MNRRTILVFLLFAICTGCKKRFVAKSSSMVPTINPGDVVIVKQPRASFQRFDIVAFNNPVSSTSVFVMRIVGLPGETIAYNGSGLIVNGRQFPSDQLPSPLRGKSWQARPGLPRTTLTSELTLDQNQVFVVGDNLANANDSRFWGPLHTSNVIGVVSVTRQSKK
jgi:signal peptidase I